jgi:phospholipid/cholesterol/gamma-HCH transport system substrate-binding protein
MRRAIAITLVLIALVAVWATGAGAGGDDGQYEVRAIFDNASFVVVGEDVRVGGAKVGSVADVSITGKDEVATESGDPAPGKAAVVVRIDDAAFQDFRIDASCLIRPQSLIGEKFVECKPTEPRAPGTQAPPELSPIADGQPGAGQYLLPLERNGKAVDLDLVNNIMREPYPDRFRLILNDLGAGLAARGDELAEIVDRANPALRETNDVLAILRGQNHALERLATDGDQVITALAGERESVAGFINSSETVGTATAERQADLEAGFQKLPGFLRELRSTMDELSQFSNAATPVFSDLGAAAPSLTKLNQETIPFSNAGIPAVQSLGASAAVSGPALAGSDSVIRQIRGLANNGVSASKNLKKLLASLRKTGGFEGFLKLLFGLGGTVNGFDQYGHFVRALVPTNNCFDQIAIPQNGCNANFFIPSLKAKAKTPTKKDIKQALRDTARATHQGSVQADQTESQPSEPPTGATQGGESVPGAPSGDATGTTTTTTPDTETGPPPTTTTPETTPTPGDAPQQEQQFGASRQLMEFLLGDGHSGGSR